MAAGPNQTEITRLDALLWDRAATGGSAPSLAELVRMTHAVPRQPVTIETLIADNVAPIAALATRFRYVETRSFGLVSVMRVQHPDGSFVLSAWPTGYEGVFHLVGSIPSTDRRWGRVERAVRNASPSLAPCFIDHDDFIAVGTALTEHGQVEVSRLTARRPIDFSSLQRGWQQQSGMLRPDPMQAIGQAESEDASVRTLTLHVSNEDQGVLNLHLRRVAGATFYSGDFAVFNDVVLTRLAAAAAQRARLLSGRQRALGQPLPKAISVHLPKPVLTDAQATSKVIEVLESGSALSIAVMHRNPYLHLVVTDNTDGSNFDVVVTETDSIDVFPGFRASMGSFNRLTQRLGEHFEALSIAEASPVEQISLDDLVTNA